MIRKIKQIIKNILCIFGVEIKRIETFERECVSLKPRMKSKGNVLLSYIVAPFKADADKSLINSHTRHWECYQIAKTFLDLGYSVDVVNQNGSAEYIPEKDYAFYIETYCNLEKVAHRLNKDCIKIMHVEFAYWLHHNLAEYTRLSNLKKRRGIVLGPKRTMKPHYSYERADYVTLLGNSFASGTYDHIKKPIFKIPISASVIFPSPKDKDYENCKRTFLYFGGWGFVHKGLDLVLDAFVRMPDYQLYVCCPIDKEREFEQAFHRELYETPNIHTIGWVDVGRPEFLDIANKCLGVVFPSSSEGMCGGVVQCMHAGLIPVISYETGVDVFDFGVILEDCSLEKIKDAIHTVSAFPAEKLKEMSLGAWRYARANHTRERFAQEYSNAINEIIARTRRHAA